MHMYSYNVTCRYSVTCHYSVTCSVQLCHAHVYLKSFIRDGQVVMEELISAIMTPEGRHLAQQHVILVVLAHGQASDLQHQKSMQSVVGTDYICRYASLFA